MNNRQSKQDNDDKYLMMQGEFNKKLWLLRGIILAINLILLILFISRMRMSLYGNQHYDALIPVIGLIQTVGSFILTCLRFKITKVLSIILIITGTATYMLNLVGLI